jgi:hypothetical protein
MEFYRQYKPEEFAAMTEADFALMGEQAQQEIEAEMLQSAGPDQEGEDYLEKASRLSRAKHEAARRVMKALLT